MKKYLQLEELSAYREAVNLCNAIWDIVQDWDYFSKDTVGKQWVRAADSISANIAEGFGRYTKKDKIHFYRYSYGSIQEVIDWSNKAKTRKLITINEYQIVMQSLTLLPKQVHHLISFTNEKLRV